MTKVYKYPADFIRKDSPFSIVQEMNGDGHLWWLEKNGERLEGTTIWLPRDSEISGYIEALNQFLPDIPITEEDGRPDWMMALQMEEESPVEIPPDEEIHFFDRDKGYMGAGPAWITDLEPGMAIPDCFVLSERVFVHCERSVEGLASFWQIEWVTDEGQNVVPQELRQEMALNAHFKRYLGIIGFAQMPDFVQAAVGEAISKDHSGDWFLFDPQIFEVQDFHPQWVKVLAWFTRIEFESV